MMLDGWKKTDLGSCLVGSSLRNSTLQLSHNDLRAVNKKYGMIPMKDQVKGKGVERAKVVRKGWFAYNPMRLNIGSICRWPGEKECIVSPDYVVFHCDDSVLLDDYFDHFRKSHRWNKFMEDAGRGSVRIRIYLKDLALLQCHIPPIAEQTKIAKILSTWVQAIETTEKLAENAKAQKKALMQQLLTGKRRLPGFEGLPWQQVRLGDLGQTFTGLTGKTKEDFGGGMAYIPYLNIFQNSRINPQQFDYVTVGHNERQNRVQFGDIFFTTSSETPDEVGMSSVLLDEVPDLFLNSFCFGFRLHDFQTLCPEFARFLLRGQDVRRLIHRLAQGATRYNLSKTHLMDLKLILPSVKEQERIAEVIDAAQTLETDLLVQNQKLQQQKTALMQQLLNGKRRVKVDGDA